MPRQALIKLRRGSGLPANNALQEGELAIDVSAKKLYSANSTGYAFSLAGDQYNLSSSGNSSQGVVTLTVDNDTLSNDSINFVGSGGLTVSGNSSQLTFNSPAGTDYDFSAGGSATTGTFVLGGDADADTVTLSGGDNITVTNTSTTAISVSLDSAVDLGASGSLSVGNSTVNAVVHSNGSITSDGNIEAGTFSMAGGAITANAAELNILDGATLDTTELNYVDGVTSSIQTQIDTKVANSQAVSFTTITASGLADLNGALEVAGITTLSGNVVMSDALSVTDIVTMSANASVGGDLAVTGLADLNGGLDVTGLANVSGNAVFSDSVTVADGLTLSGGSLTVGNSTVNAVISSAGAIDADGAGAFGGNLSAGGTLAITGTSTLTGNVAMSDDASVGGDLTVSGNLTVSGTQTIVSSSTVALTDSLLKLAQDQTGTDTDAVDIGIYGVYDVGGTDTYSGFFRDQSDSNKKWVLVDGITAEPGTTVTYSSSDLAYLEAIIDGGTY